MLDPSPPSSVQSQGHLGSGTAPQAGAAEVLLPGRDTRDMRPQGWSQSHPHPSCGHRAAGAGYREGEHTPSHQLFYLIHLTYK